MKKNLLAIIMFFGLVGSANALDIQTATCSSSDGKLYVTMQVSMMDKVLNENLVVDILDGGNWYEFQDTLPYTGSTYQQSTFNLTQLGYSNPQAFQLAIDDSYILLIGSCN